MKLGLFAHSRVNTSADFYQVQHDNGNGPGCGIGERRGRIDVSAQSAGIGTTESKIAGSKSTLIGLLLLQAAYWSTDISPNNSVDRTLHQDALDPHAVGHRQQERFDLFESEGSVQRHARQCRT